MSREERRAYQRMMKGSDRTPQLPPAARARLDRARAKREARQTARGQGPASSRGFWIRSSVAAVLIGLIGFSLAWDSGMPFAAYVGLGVTAVVLAFLVGLRALRRRSARA